jgi:hypothetical protein
MQGSEEKVSDGASLALGEGPGYAGLRVASALAHQMLSAPLGSAPGARGDAGLGPEQGGNHGILTQSLISTSPPQPSRPS